MKSKFIGIFMVLLLVGSLVPATAVTDDEVNEYSSKVAEFVKEKCHEDCENVILLGDDYVIPSFRRSIQFLNWYFFFSTNTIDKILTDIGYVQRKTKTFANFDDLFKINENDNSYDGKDVLIVRPDNPSSDQDREIDEFKSMLNSEGYNPDFEEKLGSDVSCNDPGFFSDYNGRTIFVFGTEENNDAYNCFPFQAGLEKRDAAFIDINPWDGRNYAVIVNTNDPNVIDAFTKLIEDDGYQNLSSESAYFFAVSTDVAGYLVLGVAATALIVGTGGLAAPALLVAGWVVTEVAVDGAEAVDTCVVNPEGAGWCTGTIFMAVLPGAVGPTKDVVKKGIKKLEQTNLADFLKPVDNMIKDNFPTLMNKFGKGDVIRIQSEISPVHLAKGSDSFLRGATTEADKLRRLNEIPSNLDDAGKLRFIGGIGELKDGVSKIEWDDVVTKNIKKIDEYPLSNGGKNIMQYGNSNSKVSEAVSFENFYKRGMKFLKGESSVKYTGGYTKMPVDYLGELDGEKVAVQVKRAMDSSKPLTVDEIVRITENGLDGLEKGITKVDASDLWDRGVVHLIVKKGDEALVKNAMLSVDSSKLSKNQVIISVVDDIEEMF